jgi:hypothetical protein
MKIERPTYESIRTLNKGSLIEVTLRGICIQAPGTVYSSDTFKSSLHIPHEVTFEIVHETDPQTTLPFKLYVPMDKHRTALELPKGPAELPQGKHKPTVLTVKDALDAAYADCSRWSPVSGRLIGYYATANIRGLVLARNAQISSSASFAHDNTGNNGLVVHYDAIDSIGALSRVN